MYVLQMRVQPRKKWETVSKRFATVEEAEAALKSRPIQSIYRIAEEYTVVRYKEVKAK